jgi:TonB family protein
MDLPLPNRALSNRITRSAAAILVLLVHVALVWIVILMRAPTPEDTATEPVIATLLYQPRPRNLALGPVPIHVRMENALHLQRFAPRIQDIPVDKPEPPQAPLTVPLPASASLPEQATAGLNGEESESSGHSGGGFSITLLQRVIPRYPAAAARRHEEGVTQVNLHIESSGRVSDVNITRSSGSPELDKAAVAAFRKWKFAQLSTLAPKEGVWLRTEQRFIRYRFKYSRLGGAADSVDVSEIKPATEEPTPGSKEALTRFISTVGAGEPVGGSGFLERSAVEKMRTALEEWGAVKSIRFTGTAGERRWETYQPVEGGHRVEVGWNMFEVRHQHAIIEWLVAVDRNGTVWSASASPAPWM